MRQRSISISRSDGDLTTLPTFSFSVLLCQMQETSVSLMLFSFLVQISLNLCPIKLNGDLLHFTFLWTGLILPVVCSVANKPLCHDQLFLLVMDLERYGSQKIIILFVLWVNQISGNTQKGTYCSKIPDLLSSPLCQKKVRGYFC